MGAPTATWKGVLLGIIAARLHALWVLLTTTGLRLGEARGLQWSDIDFANGRLVVNRALQRQTGSGYVFVEPKTAQPPNHIPRTRGA